MRVLASVLLLLLTACSQPARVQSAPPIVQPAPARQTVTVTEVVDGDTVYVRFADGRTDKVRLIGIDTPETRDPRKPVQCFGVAASNRAKELLNHQTVSLELDPSQGERDRYKRLLAYLWLPDGRNFGEVMLAEGYAHEYTYRVPYAYQAEFKAAQSAAKASGAGLWAPETCGGNP